MGPGAGLDIVENRKSLILLGIEPDSLVIQIQFMRILWCHKQQLDPQENSVSVMFLFLAVCEHTGIIQLQEKPLSFSETEELGMHQKMMPN